MIAGPLPLRITSSAIWVAIRTATGSIPSTRNDGIPYAAPLDDIRISRVSSLTEVETA